MIFLKTIKKQYLLTLIFFTFYLFLNAQEAIPFKVQKEFYIYGDAAVVGNNILSKDAKQPFNTLDVTNDDIDMVFVDIDNDETTFSSSSAQLSLPKNHTKIAYATLYWSATYSYEQGFKRESGGSFFFQGKRPKKRNINKIKFKLPNGEYQNLTGKIEFDGSKSSLFRLNSPYVCSADVTKLLKQAKTVNGEYTVANIIASKGFVSGGSAAGWLLYVVYEAPTTNPKYITTYNGFAHVGREPVHVNFKDFKSLDTGEIKTSLTIATLEGDSDLDQDHCAIFNPKTSKNLVLSSNLRDENNFFNSKITNRNKEISNRIPNSKNTLGFDIATLDIPKNTTQIIDNNTEEVSLVFNTNSDRFYLFFTAFQTEISKAFYKQKSSSFNEGIVETSSEKTTDKIEKVKSAKNNLNTSKTATNKVKKKKKPKIKYEKKINKEIENKEGKDNKLKKKSNKKEKTDKVKKVKKSKKEKQPKKKKKTVKPIKTKEAKPKPEMAENAKNIIASGTKELPVWLKQDNSNTTKVKTLKPNNLALKSSRLIGEYLELTRENYKELLIPDDYIYETQTFKRIYNQKPTIIQGAEEGYYIINAIVTDAKAAIDLQFELRVNGINSNIIEDQNNSKFYIYLFKSSNFYDTFMQRKAFSKTEIIKNCWIINIKQ